MKFFQQRPSQANSKTKGIGKKVGNVVTVMLAISIILAVSLCVTIFRTLTTDMLKARCTNGTNILAYELERVNENTDLNALLDELKSRMGCEFTIFEGDTRAYTTVIQNGQRVVGTKLSADLSNTILTQGQSYVGNASLLGNDFLCSYVPTRNASGQVNGLIFAGISSEDANQQTLVAVLLSIVASIAAIIVCNIILVIYLKKRVSVPLAEITQVAGRLAHGDLGVSNGKPINISIQSNDEIGQLGQMFMETSQRLRSYIGEIATLLNAIANGDMTKSSQLDYVGDFMSIRRSLEDIENRLNDTIGQIKQSAEQVAGGADQVSNSSQALAQGATEQASSIQELSATITEISNSAKRTAQATEEAGQFVEQVGSQLGVSVEYIKQLNTAMEKISTSSEEISKIISTIENIAFQTNILALNAAVEAARAGTAGKGFAVVADEVRNLANKSDEAAKATKHLIESSIVAVTEGSDVVEKVTQFLEQTSDMAGGVTGKMNVVVDAVENQTTAINQITEGIEQISAVVQTNSATSEESAAASEQLSSQAGLLKGLVDTFQLKPGAH